METSFLPPNNSDYSPPFKHPTLTNHTFPHELAHTSCLPLGLGFDGGKSGGKRREERRRGKGRREKGIPRHGGGLRMVEEGKHLVHSSLKSPLLMLRSYFWPGQNHRPPVFTMYCRVSITLPTQVCWKVSLCGTCAALKLECPWLCKWLAVWLAQKRLMYLMCCPCLSRTPFPPLREHVSIVGHDVRRTSWERTWTGDSWVTQECLLVSPKFVLSSEHVNSGLSNEISNTYLSQTLESNLVLLRETEQAFQLLSAWFSGMCTWPWGGNTDWEHPICIKCPHIHDSRSCPLLAPSALRYQLLPHLLMAARRAPSGIIYLLGLSSHTSVSVQGKLVCPLPSLSPSGAGHPVVFQK